jgi:hypothetical protein
MRFCLRKATAHIILDARVVWIRCNASIDLLCRSWEVAYFSSLSGNMESKSKLVWLNLFNMSKIFTKRDVKPQRR